MLLDSKDPHLKHWALMKEKKENLGNRKQNLILEKKKLSAYQKLDVISDFVHVIFEEESNLLIKQQISPITI